MRGVGDRRDQARIDHRGAEPEQHAADEPPAELRVAAVRNRPAACTHMPATIRPLRPQRSLSGPVTICKTPQSRDRPP